MAGKEGGKEMGEGGRGEEGRLAGKEGLKEGKEGEENGGVVDGLIVWKRMKGLIGVTSHFID